MNVSIATLLATQKAIVEAALATLDDPDGVVLTRERYIDEDQWIKLFRAINEDEAPKGVMILWQNMSQTKGSRICTVRQTHRFSYEILYPFDDNRPDGLTSYEVFVARVEAINNALNNEGIDFDLGITTLGSDVQHDFLQTDELLVRRWGAGSTAVKTHYTSATIEVNVTVLAHAEDAGS